MPTSNLVTKTLGKIEYGSGDGTPNHVSPRGSFYIDNQTGKLYIRRTRSIDEANSGWTPVIKPQQAEVYLQSNTTATTTSQNLWSGISGTGTVSVFNSNTFTYSRTFELISPTGSGGFESSLIQGTNGFAANGWTVNNGAQAAKWYVGTTGASGSGFGAYISSNNGVNNTYNNGTLAASSVYFYRDVVVPAYVTSLTLSFAIRVTGENFGGTPFDYVRVYNSPTSTPFTAGQVYTGQVGQYLLLSGYQTQTIALTVTASSFEQTRRIAFGWRNDGSGGADPPASIDSISLVANLPISLTYTGSQSTFRSLLTGSFQATTAIANVGVQISKNTLTASNISESTFNIGTTFKDSFTTQNTFTMSNGDVIRPLLINKSSSTSITVNDLTLGIWEIE